MGKDREDPEGRERQTQMARRQREAQRIRIWGRGTDRKRGKWMEGM